MAIAILLLSSQGRSDETRDPWLDPFPDNSIWNTTIGKSAELKNADLQDLKGIEPEFEYIYRISNAPFVRPVYKVNSWHHRVGTETVLDEIPIDDFIMGSHPYDMRYPASCAAFLMPNKRSVKNFTAFCRTYRANPCYADSMKNWDLFDGIGLDDGRPHSGMSILGGSIRLDGHNQLSKIEHAIKFCFPVSMLSVGEQKLGYRWPATRAGQNHVVRYKGTDPEFMLGSLLTLDPQRYQSLQENLTTEFGKAIAHAMHDYGAYVADESSSPQIKLCITPEVMGQLTQTSNQIGYRRNELASFPANIANDLKLILESASIVVDNSIETQGGKGERRVSSQRLSSQSPIDFCGELDRIIPVKNGFMTDSEFYPEYWFFAFPSKEMIGFSVDPNIFYSAPKSMRFNALGHDKDVIVSQFNFEPKSADIRFSARVKVDGKVKLSMETAMFGRGRVTGDRYNITELVIDSDEPSSDAAGWHLIQGVVHLKDSTRRYRIQFTAVGEGTVWIDDVDAVAVKPEPTTAPEVPAVETPPAP